MMCFYIPPNALFKSAFISRVKFPFTTKNNFLLSHTVNDIIEILSLKLFFCNECRNRTLVFIFTRLLDCAQDSRIYIILFRIILPINHCRLDIYIDSYKKNVSGSIPWEGNIRNIPWSSTYKSVRTE